MSNRRNIPVVNLPHEVWRRIKGFENLYAVSNKKRVKSYKRKGVNGYSITEKILRPGKHKSGYAKYTLCKDGKFYYVNRHRLMATAFIPNPKNLPCINHIDNDPTNDELSNLEWCTLSHNTRHAYKTNRLSKLGEKNSMCKLTSEKVMHIFNFQGDKNILVKKYGIVPNTVNDIKSGRRWSSVTGKRHPSVKKRLCEY